MMEKPFISIIIPFFNTPEPLIRRCIDSALRQTYENYEIIIVDDGSAKEYVDCLAGISALDERIRVLHQANAGSAVARNKGMKEARYDYIMFLDSDDTIIEYCLEDAANAILEYDCDLVIGLVKKFKETDIIDRAVERTEQPARLTISTNAEKEELISHMLGVTSERFSFENGYIADGPIVRVVRRSIALHALFSEESIWNDDTIWNIKMLHQCGSIVIVNALWYQYILYSESKTRRFRKNCPSEFAFRTRQELDLMKELWPDCFQAIYKRMQDDIYILSRTFLFHPQNQLSWKEKYRIYKSCIHQDAYREALRGLNWRREKRIHYRIMKELLRLTSLYGPNIVSYMILSLHERVKQRASKG